MPIDQLQTKSMINAGDKVKTCSIAQANILCKAGLKH